MCRLTFFLQKMCWAPGGDRFATYTAGGERVEIWSTIGGSRLFALDHDTIAVQDCVWMSDDALLSTSELGVLSTLWDLESGHTATLPACKLPPTGRCLAFSADRTLCTFVTRAASSDELVVLTRARANLHREDVHTSSPATWAVSKRLTLPSTDASRVRICRSDSAALVVDGAEGRRAWLVSLVGGDDVPQTVLDLNEWAAAASPSSITGSTTPGPGSGLGVRVCAVSGDGGPTSRTVALGCYDGWVCVASEDTGALAARLRLPERVDGSTVTTFVELLSEGGRPSRRPRPRLSEDGRDAAMEADAEGQAATAGQRIEDSSGNKTAVGSAGTVESGASTALAASTGVVELDGAAKRVRAGPSSGDAGRAVALAGVSRLAMSPCGRWLAWRDERERCAVAIAGSHGTELRVVVVAASPVTRLLWRPETSGEPTLVTVTQRGNLLIVQPGLHRAWLADVAEATGVKTAQWDVQGRRLLLFNGQRCFLATTAPAADAAAKDEEKLKDEPAGAAAASPAQISKAPRVSATGAALTT